MSYIGNSPGVASQRVTTTLTATAGQTQFTTQSGYVLGYVDVYLNGAKLVNGSDFEAITGTYITLFSGAIVGDVVELISYVPRGLTDGYTKAEADAKFLDVGGDTATGSLALAAVGITGALTLSGGTANGIGYLNSSKVLTTGSALTFDGTNFATTGIITAGSSVLSTASNNTARMIAAAGGAYFGSTTAADVIFQYNQNEGMRLNSIGLGIGTTSPSGKLHVYQTQGSMYIDNAGGIPRMRLGGGNGWGFNRITATEDIFFGEPGDTGTWRVRGSGTISLGVGNNNTSMTIVGDGGNIGIGTTVPSHTLTVQGSLGATTSLSALTLLTLRNSLDGGVGINFTNSVSIPLASINALVTSSGAGTDDGILSFSTATNATNTERMRIDSSGNVSINTSSSFNSAKLSISGKISAGDGQSTSGSTLLEGYYGAGALTIFGTEYSSGGPVIAYGMRPSISGAAAFTSAYGGGGNLAYSAISQAGDIKFYTSPGQTLALNATVTISERFRITTAGALVGGHNAGWSYTTDVSSIVLSNGGTDTPNLQFLTGTNKNWGIDSWNPSSTQSTQYLRFVKDINESNGFAAVFISPIGSIGIGNTLPSSGVGIAFPPTQVASTDANTLDDYEEGTWTPALDFDGVGVTSYTDRYGTYTKIGRQVTVSGRLVVNVKGSGTGLARIYGLPFSAGSFGNSPTFSGSCTAVTTMAGVTGTIGLWIDNTGGSIIPYINENGGGNFTFGSNWQTGSGMTFTMTYFV